MIPLYDAHNHLQDERLAPILENALQDLPALGLQRCVVNGTSEADWPAVSKLAQRCPWIQPAFGLHPWFTAQRSEKWFDKLQSLLDQHPNATIGEIGLDRWMRDPNLSDQETVFTQQLQLAAQRNLPVTIHCLKAWGQLQSILQEQPPPPKGFLLHSFSGSHEVAASLSKLGAYFSISGYFAHARKAQQREVFKKIPIELLLIETDAPDMPPPIELQSNSLPDQANHPANIKQIYQFAADLRETPLEDFSERISLNFRRLFGPNSSTV